MKSLYGHSLGVLLLMVVTEEEAGERPSIMWLPLMKTSVGKIVFIYQIYLSTKYI